MSKVEYPPPADGQTRAMSLALDLGGPRVLAEMEAGGGLLVTEPLPVFQMAPLDAGSVERAVGEARQLGWRYLAFAGNNAKIADFNDIATLGDEDGNKPPPTILHDPDQVQAIISAGLMGETHADQRPDQSFEARLLRVPSRPENWLWFHAGDDGLADELDFVVTLDEKPHIVSLHEQMGQWLNDTPRTQRSAEDHPEAGG